MRQRKKVNRWRKDCRGFTLIELIISMGIMSVLLLVVVSIILIMYENYYELQIRYQQMVILDGISDAISEEVRYTTDLIIGSEDDEIYVDYHELKEEDGILYLDDSILWDSTDVDQEIELEFCYEETAVYNVYIEIEIVNTSGFSTGYSTSECIAVKLVNMELLENPVTNQNEASNGIIYK